MKRVEVKLAVPIVAPLLDVIREQAGHVLSFDKRPAAGHQFVG